MSNRMCMLRMLVDLILCRQAMLQEPTNPQAGRPCFPVIIATL